MQHCQTGLIPIFSDWEIRLFFSLVFNQIQFRSISLWNFAGFRLHWCTWWLDLMSDGILIRTVTECTKRKLAAQSVLFRLNKYVWPPGKPVRCHRAWKNFCPKQPLSPRCTYAWHLNLKKWYIDLGKMLPFNPIWSWLGYFARINFYSIIV